MPEILTLIVCTLGRREPLRRLLTSLRAQSDDRFEVILVDQNLPGFLEPVLHDFPDLPLRAIHSRAGLSRARNAGIALADSALIGFPDDDCWYAPETVADVIDRFERDPIIDVLTGRTVDAGGKESVSVHLTGSQPITRANVFLAGNSNTIFVRREVLAAVGGFDETLGVGAGTMFGSGEETDFLLACLREGFAVRYDRDFLVHHDQVGAGGSNFARIRAYSAGFGRVCRLHGLGAAFVGGRIARASLRSALFLVSGNLRQARERWCWIRGCVSGFVARSQ